MSTSLVAVLDRVRQEEYVGENRCVPCTAVNVAIAAALSAAVAIVVSEVVLEPAGAALLGGGVFLLSLATIYLRGYLVPGTPWFTKAYFPDRVLRAFEKEPPAPTEHTSMDRIEESESVERSASTGAADAGDTGEHDAERSDVESFLISAGALTEAGNGADLDAPGEFRAAWRERIAELREDEDVEAEFAARNEVDRENLAFEDFGAVFVALVDRREVDSWPSRAAMTADLAAGDLLRDRHGDWADLDEPSKNAVHARLRAVLDTCPACEGPVTAREETVESCCRSESVVERACEDCGARIAEFEP